MTSTSDRERLQEGEGDTTAPDGLVRELQDLLEISPYEARLLLALLRLRSANSLQLTRLSGVPRTSVYQVMEGLCERGLAESLTGDGPATWSSVGRETILTRLDAAQREAEERHRINYEEAVRDEARRRLHVREMLAESFEEVPALAMPYVQIIRSAQKVKRCYDDLLRHARSDLMMFTRPPYASGPRHVDRAVLDMVARGVSARVLYQSGHTDRHSFAIYHAAGVQARVVDQLPVKLVVVDQTVAMVSMADPTVPEGGYPTTLLIEHPGYAEFAVDAFERRWGRGRPYAPPKRSRKAIRPQQQTA